MCPERRIISLYVDGELPSPWKEKLEAHLNSCPKCSGVLARYRRLGDDLAELPEKTVLAAQDRVWKKLTAPELIIPGKAKAKRPEKRIWNRNITLPLPAAAAAAVLVIAVFFALIGMGFGNKPSAQDSVAAINISQDDQGILPIQDMADLLQYLSGQENGDFMVIRLPESRKFSRPGEPALINAADYSRRSISR